MKVLLWSDGKRDGSSFFPSLPLMKISAYHKRRGDSVDFYKEGDVDCDVFYKSKVFSFTEDNTWTPKTGQVKQGGSGYAITLIDGKEVYKKEQDRPIEKEVEESYPDYSLYPEFKKTALGFLTRGCPRRCGFCIVSHKDGCKSEKVADLTDIWRGQKYLKLMDANILASKDREGLIKQIIKSGSFVDYTQGLDARLVDDDIAKLLCKTKAQMIHFAFDNIKDETAVMKGLRTFKKHCTIGTGATKVYVLTNYNSTFEEDMHRIRLCVDAGYQPYTMIYNAGEHDDFLRHLKRWTNSPYFHACDFSEYRPNKNSPRMIDIYGDITKVRKG